MIGVFHKWNSTVIEFSKFRVSCTRGGRFEPFYCNDTYLPPENEVWGKAIFSQASVCLQGRWGLPNRDPPWTEIPLYGKEWAGQRPPPVRQRAGVTHPSGMHSCFVSEFAEFSKTFWEKLHCLVMRFLLEECLVSFCKVLLHHMCVSV